VTAISTYKNGLEVECVALPPDYTNIIMTLTNIAQIHRERANYVLAQEVYMEVLNLQENKLRSSHVDVAFTHFNIGMALFHIEREYCNLALDYLQEAYMVRSFWVMTPWRLLLCCFTLGMSL